MATPLIWSYGKDYRNSSMSTANKTACVHVRHIFLNLSEGFMTFRSKEVSKHTYSIIGLVRVVFYFTYLPVVKQSNSHIAFDLHTSPRLTCFWNFSMVAIQICLVIRTQNYIIVFYFFVDIIGLDKNGYPVNVFLISPRKHNVVEYHNICFCWEIRKI